MFKKENYAMKKIISILLCVIMLVSILPTASFAVSGKTYYVDSISGDDSSSGTSASGAWRTTNNLASLQLNPGDKVLFRRGGVYECTLTLTCSGTKDNPIIISAYGEGERPLLRTSQRNAVFKLFDCDYVTVSDFEITAHNGGGIWVDAVNKDSCGVTIKNVILHDMQNFKVRTRDNFSEGPISGRAAIVVRRYGNALYSVDDFTAVDCEIYDCGNGIFFTGDSTHPNKNSLVENVYIHDLDGEAVVIESCDGAVVTNCKAINCCQGEGVDENGKVLYYIAAMWFHYSTNCTIQNTEIAGQRCIGDGMTVDFDHWSFGCTYQYIYSHDNTRFMVNNSKDDNPNRGNTVRYCLSVNDGSSERWSTLSASAGEFGFKFYNNTLVNSGGINFDDTYDSVIANNIFVLKDDNRISYDYNQIKNSGTVFSNNCYYNSMTPLVDIKSYNVLPGFSGDDLYDPNSYKLSAGSPLIGAGLEIAKESDVDFFGNEITSNNIGCYGGNGTEAEYQQESLNDKLHRSLTDIFNYVVSMIKNEIKRYIKKLIDKIL